MKKCFEDWGWYAILTLAGVPLGFAVPSDKMQQALLVVGTVILTAFIATLFPPFASFTEKERWQKFCVQYGTVPTFGMYGALLYRLGGLSWPGIACASLVLFPYVTHMGSWKSGFHSRTYRIELFFASRKDSYPALSELLFTLSMLKYQDVADEIVQSMPTGRQYDFARVRQLIPHCSSMIEAASSELQVRQRKYFPEA